MQPQQQPRDTKLMLGESQSSFWQLETRLLHRNFHVGEGVRERVPVFVRKRVEANQRWAPAT